MNDRQLGENVPIGPVKEAFLAQVHANQLITDLTDEQWGLLQEISEKLACPLPRRDVL
jgi:hypothetical protein